MSDTCSICSRKITEKSYADEHHLVPKSKGGKYSDKIRIHRICHEKIHSLWTESELVGYYNTIERILEHGDMKSFVKWVSKRPPEFHAKTKTTNKKRKRR